MNTADLRSMTVEELVRRFETITTAQDQALLRDELSRFNRLFREMEDVKTELRSRAGDQRRALLALYDHPNAQVRVKAIKATLAVAPEKARRALEQLADSGEYPQSGEAGMSLSNLDEGIFRPE